jgi:hypothetical protein
MSCGIVWCGVEWEGSRLGNCNTVWTQVWVLCQVVWCGEPPENEMKPLDFNLRCEWSVVLGFEFRPGHHQQNMCINLYSSLWTLVQAWTTVLPLGHRLGCGMVWRYGVVWYEVMWCWRGVVLVWNGVEWNGVKVWCGMVRSDVLEGLSSFCWRDCLTVVCVL